MPDPKSDFGTSCSIIERKLRSLKRDIVTLDNEVQLFQQNKMSKDVFKAKLSRAEADWNKFIEKWDERDQLEVRFGDPDAWPTKQWQETYDQLRNVLCNGTAVLHSLEAPLPPPSSLHDLNSSITQNLNDAHLPKINIPIFSGDLIQWSFFKDTFKSMVHDEVSLTKIKKFHYLKSALRGEAASLISRIPICDESYDQAWKKMLETYDNPRILAFMYVNRILDCDAKSQRAELSRLESFLCDVGDGIEGFRALTNIGDKADFLLSSLALRALDSSTRRQFELSQNFKDKAPSADDVLSFVRQRCSALKLSAESFTLSSSYRPFSPSNSSVSSSSSRSSYPRRQSPKYNTSVTFHSSDSRSSSQKNHQRGPSGGNKPRNQTNSSNPIRNCPFCKGDHLLPYCLEFSNLSLQRRVGFVQGWQGCKNCLRDGHKVADCPSKWTCRFCKGKHHSLIHEEPNSPPVREQPRNHDRPAQPEPDVFIGFQSDKHVQNETSSLVLLATVQLLVKGPGRSLCPARAILDSGSQHTFISSSLATRLGGSRSRFHSQITGIGGSTISQPLGVMACTVKPFDSSTELSVDAVIISNITRSLPPVQVDESIISKLSHLNLADIAFDTPGQVDVLIGADLYSSVVIGAPQASPVSELSLLPTIFGLSVIGKVAQSTRDTSTFFIQCSSDIECQLKAFWEIEEPAHVSQHSPEEQYCEEHFLKTHTRTDEGRYMVRLPIKPTSPPLSSNRTIAERRLGSLQSKLSRDTILAQHYNNFMNEYVSLGHMSPSLKPSSYIIPHHGIWQSSKLRVVFDASCSPSPHQPSLNELLLSGPRLQQDITIILTRFRGYQIPLCADLVKMYRQILVHPDDRHLQHILWSEGPQRPPVEFELNTVTYGVKSSPFHALRVINKLVEDEGSQFPLAADRALNDRFVDDFATGADTIEEAQILQEQLIGLFSKAGFTFSKWASTVQSLIPDAQRGALEPVIINQDTSPSCGSVKVLGLIWNPQTDSFSYRIQCPLSTKVSKRTVLSAISRIFDPLGFLAPVIFVAKSLLQDIWKAKLEWDDELPENLLKSWLILANEWSHITSINVPRLITSSDSSKLLIGFCDASIKGYSASVYLRSEKPNGSTLISLVKAKTKVAPTKFVSIARLELCGALLLSRVLSSISLDGLHSSNAICFTDSSIVLSWLNQPIHSLKVFEANRVSQILSVTSLFNWRHIKSEENPCDISSRGCSPSKLIFNNLWWHGPHWLHQPVSLWPEPIFKVQPATVLVTHCSSAAAKTSDDWMSRFSRLNILVRVVVRMLRFKELLKSDHKPMSRPILATEFADAKLRCIKVSQLTHFPQRDPERLKEIQQLSPFFDERSILRVGGRLTNAPIDYQSKHPILVPATSHLARLIIEDIHQRHFHAGPNLVLSLLRSEFWIPRARKLIRSCIQRCVHCRTLRAKPLTPIMAPLPKDRFHQRRAFLSVGIDFAGPILIKDSNRRRATETKAYLCIFVCMACKAVHLEAVTSLSTPAFLAAFERFTSRRGLPATVWSDNGTNFVGASRFIKDIYLFMSKERDYIAEKTAPLGIEWKFIPPRAPHFGGLWEAGVKSMKNLLINVIGKHSYTFEEISTILSRIESLMNSRPLCPLSEDSDDCNFLTPGHFLIGDSLKALPEPDDLSRSSTPHSRWEAARAQISTIWNRWRRDYLHSLQPRSKWTRSCYNLQVGDLVILLEKRSLVGEWPVGRVTEIYPGRDGTVRSVLVRTPSSRSYHRPVTSLVPLFADSSCTSDQSSAGQPMSSC